MEIADIYNNVVTDKTPSGISFMETPNFADSNRSNPFPSFIPPPTVIIYPPGTYISVNNTEEKSMKTLSYFHKATQASKNPSIITAAVPSVLLSSSQGRRGCGLRNRTRAQRLRVNHVLHVRSRGSCYGYINTVSLGVQGGFGGSHHDGA